MFTKIRRFVVFVVIGFALALLVGCGDDKTPTKPTLKNPTEIAILVEYAPFEKATNVGGADIILAVDVEDGCNDEVIWTSNNPEIATVDENGFVTAVAPGEVTILAYSKVAPSVQDEITLRIHPADIGQLLLEASEYVRANLNYINGRKKRTLLPCEFKSDLLTYAYKNADVAKNITYTDNYYVPAEDWREKMIDSVDTLKCTITYAPTGDYVEIMVQIWVVKDEQVNDFTTVFAARDAINALFADENLEEYQVAEKLLTIEKNEGVAVQWTSSNDKVLKVTQTAGVETEDNKTDDEFKVEYTRPIDNTEVQLVATILSAGAYGETVQFNITAKGYTKTEKVAYFQNEICGSLPAATTEIRKDLVLPTYDPQFGMQISWASDHPELLSAEGVYTDDVTKTDPTQGQKVTLTATLLYLTANETSDGSEPFTDVNSFKETVTFEYNVFPCTSAARAANTVAAYAKAHVADGTGWFPWGKIDRASNQLTGLPATMGEAGVEGDWANVALNWTCEEEGLFDANMNLLKQYLRYHRVMLTATVQLGDATEVIEVPLNVGIAQKERTSHIGGSFSRLAVQKNDSVMLAMDSLQALSAFDGRVGSQQAWYKGDQKGQFYEFILGASEDLQHNLVVQPATDEDPTYATKPVTFSMQMGIGINCGFGGVTLYWDDPDTGIRFQFYATEAMTWVIGPDDVDENGDLRDADGNGKIYSMLDRYHQNWDHVLFVNMSGKSIRIPISYSKEYDNMTSQTYQTTYVPYDQKIFGNTEKYGSEGLGAISLTLYGGDAAGLVQANGQVGCIEAEAKWNDLLFSLTDGYVDEAGTVEYCQYLTLENGGIAWTAGEAQDDGYTDSKGASVHHTAKEYIATMFSTAGNELHVEFWNIHPCNTFTTNDSWLNAANGLTGKVQAEDDTSTLTNVYFWARTLNQEAYHVNQAWVDAAAAEQAQ